MNLKDIKLNCCGGNYELAMEKVVNDKNFLVEGYRNNTAVNACCVMWAWRGDGIEEEVSEEIAEGKASHPDFARSAIMCELIKNFVAWKNPDAFEEIDWYDFELRVDKIAEYLDYWGPAGMCNDALDYMMEV